MPTALSSVLPPAPAQNLVMTCRTLIRGSDGWGGSADGGSSGAGAAGQDGSSSQALRCRVWRMTAQNPSG